MALPGLHVSTPVAESKHHNTYELKERTEWRFEVAFANTIEVKVSIISIEGQKSMEYVTDTQVISAHERECRALWH